MHAFTPIGTLCALFFLISGISTICFFAVLADRFKIEIKRR